MYLITLTFPLDAKETGVLYFKKVNGKYGWFDSGNDKKDWKYIGEIKKGKPNGTGVLSSPFGKYTGEVKYGMRHGQGTYIYKSGRKRVGEFRKNKPWNVKSYDKKGKLETEWIEGKKIKKKERKTLAKKEVSDHEQSKMGVRALFGNTSGNTSTSNSSLSLIWENYGLGFNQMSFKTTSSKEKNVFEVENTSLDLSYTLDLTNAIDLTSVTIEGSSATAGVGYVFEGNGKITIANSKTKYETESVAGFGLFGLLGAKWEYLDALIGLRYFNASYSGFKSTNTTSVISLGKPYSTSGAQLIFGLGYNF